jgi:very-short-patch-repair endonuclease
MDNKNKPLNYIERIIQVIGYQEKLTFHRTIYEQKFFDILQAIRKDIDIGIVDEQKIFTDGRIAYIADFYLKKYNVIFEIDGNQHDFNVNYDQKRTAFLNSYFKVVVIRFKNEDLLNANIAYKIKKHLRPHKTWDPLLSKIPIKDKNTLIKNAHILTDSISSCKITEGIYKNKWISKRVNDG